MAPDWLTERPIAHRGLHNLARGVVENTPSSVRTAMDGGYGIEIDLQISADGEAMVHHDEELGRLTDGAGRLDAMTAAALRRVPYRATADRMITLGELCELVAGRTTLVVELKSRFDGDDRLAKRVASILSHYKGSVAVMSFDPAPIETLRHTGASIVRGIVAERWYRHQEWAQLSRSEKRSLAWLLHAGRSRPQFIAYAVKDLPAMVTIVAQRLFGLPVLTWTVRSETDRRAAAQWADQMIFEGFTPNNCQSAATGDRVLR